MKINDQIQLKFIGVDFPMINLNSLRPKEKEDKTPITINIKPQVFFPKENPNFFKIIQEIQLVSESFFELNLLAIGTFELSKSVEKDIKKAFINTNAPAIMFPYIRAFISTLTANLGNVTGTLSIPPQFFKGELKEITDIPR